MAARGQFARLTRTERQTLSHAEVRKTLHLLVNQADGPLLRLLLKVVHCCTKLRENTVAKTRACGDG